MPTTLKFENCLCWKIVGSSVLLQCHACEQIDSDSISSFWGFGFQDGWIWAQGWLLRFHTGASRTRLRENLCVCVCVCVCECNRVL